MAYYIVVVFEVSLLLLHGSEDCLEGGHQVVEDDGPPLLALGLVEAASMYHSHLLQHGGFAALAGTCIQSQSEAPAKVGSSVGEGAHPAAAA